MRTTGPVRETVDMPTAYDAAGGEVLVPVAEIPEPRGVWGPRHTRWAGLAAGAAAISLSLYGVVRSGAPGVWALGLAGLALVVGVLLTRGLDDAGAGTVYATVALGCGATGGALVVGDPALGAGLGLLVVSVAGVFGGACRVAVLSMGTTTGSLLVSGWLLTQRAGLAADEAAAVLAGVALVLAPVLESWASRLGRVPFPAPPEPRSALSTPVVRADGVLTGMLGGLSVVTVVCQVILVRGGETAALALVAVLTAGFVLRARTHRNVAQRFALLAVAGAGAVCLAADPMVTGRSGWLSFAGPALVLLAALIVLAGLQFRLRKGDPRPGGYDLFEVVSLLAVVPAVCAVLGLY